MKKSIKIFFSVLLVAILAFSLASCGEQKAAGNPEDTVTGFFTALKNADLETAQKYILTDEGDSADLNLEGEQEEILKAIFKNLDCEIVSSEETDDKSATVTAKITAVDMVTVANDVMQSGFQTILESEDAANMSTEEMQEKVLDLFVEAVADSNAATVTKEVQVPVVKNSNNEWKISPDFSEDFQDILLGDAGNILG